MGSQSLVTVPLRVQISPAERLRDIDRYEMVTYFMWVFWPSNSFHGSISFHDPYVRYMTSSSVKTKKDPDPSHVVDENYPLNLR